MAFSQKNLHCFPPFPDTKDNRTVPDHLHPQDGTIKSITFPPFLAPAKRDPGGIGFLDDAGGSVDGLMSCTESLGFESSDERRVDDQTFDEMCNHTTISKSKREPIVKTEAKKFPPPLSSLDHNGKPTFFLRPLRKDGKLELREVKISRPEILCASRQDGRLRLHLVCSDEDEDEDEEDHDDGYFEEPYEEGEEDIIEESDDEVEEIVEPITKSEEFGGDEEEEEEEEEGGEGWMIPVSPGGGSGGGDSCRRCHEVVRHHHRPHHGFHVWSSRHCVTIR